MNQIKEKKFKEPKDSFELIPLYIYSQHKDSGRIVKVLQAPLPPLQTQEGICSKNDNKTLKLNKEQAFQSLSSSKKSLLKVNFKQPSENLILKKPQVEPNRPFSEDNNLVQKPEIEQEVKIQPKVINRKYQPRPAKQSSLQLPSLQNPQKQENLNKKGYVQKMKEKIDTITTVDKFNSPIEKFENPAITEVRQQLEKIKQKDFNVCENDESVIKDEINVTRNSDKFLQSQNRLHVMKNASSHSSSNSERLKFQQSSSDKSSSKEKSISFKILRSVLKEKQYDEEVEMNYFSIEEEDDDICEWKLGDFIGSGSFGQVFQAMDCKSGKIFAVKKIRLMSNQEDRQQLKQEISFMRRLKHNHIVKLLGYDEDKEFIHIHLEYMPQGNLSQLMARFGPLAEVTIKAYSNQILDGLLYLHRKRIVHRDIKGSNILVDSEGIVKIGDFGCSSQMEKTMTLFRTSDKNAIQQLKGSIPWMPPEVITQTKYGFPADIWSFGCTVLEMATGKIPWSEYDFDNPIAAILKIGLENEIPTIPSNLSSDLQDFLKICLQRDPLKRQNAENLKIHKFLI